MKFLTIIFLFLSQFSFSQEIDCPVENGVIYFSESYDYIIKRIRKSLVNPSCETKIHSEKPISVNSVSEGTIANIIITNGLISILVKKGDEFYVYSYLTSTNLKKGDEVKIGDIIGEINKKDEFSADEDYVLNFSYWQKTKSIDVFNRLKCVKK